MNKENIEFDELHKNLKASIQAHRDWENLVQEKILALQKDQQEIWKLLSKLTDHVIELREVVAITLKERKISHGNIN
jgi:hypothetical protein